MSNKLQKLSTNCQNCPPPQKKLNFFCINKIQMWLSFSMSTNNFTLPMAMSLCLTPGLTNKIAFCFRIVKNKRIDIVIVFPYKLCSKQADLICISIHVFLLSSASILPNFLFICCFFHSQTNSDGQNYICQAKTFPFQTNWKIRPQKKSLFYCFGPFWEIFGVQ